MAKPAKNNLRIIGGSWRGRKIAFAESAGLRPTGDRIRETLFNWLQNDIAGSHCLDLFAGSGALGFEAASRGAASVVMVEKDASVAAMLNQQVELLQAPAISVQQASAESFLSSSGKPVGKIHRQSFDIVFVDPPFEARLQGPILDQLFSTDLLKPGALIYVESPRESDWQDAFEVHLSVGQFDQLRSKQTGNVIYQLFRKA